MTFEKAKINSHEYKWVYSIFRISFLCDPFMKQLLCAIALLNAF